MQAQGETLDRRRHAYRPDLAASALRGRIDAPRFVDGEPRQVARAAVALRSRPDHHAALDTELLFGELVMVYEAAGGWAWVQSARDGYVGYIPSNVLAPATNEPTHRVRSLGTFVYPQPDIKSPPIMHLSLGAQVRVTRTNEIFHELATGGFVVARHFVEVGRYARDFVEIAERFIGTPYLWGGRTRIGIDCSGLVQVCAEAAGITCPRDSDMQREEMGERIEASATLDGLKRGDLVFWQGHVGIMSDGVMIVHANAHHMAVTIETLPEAAERIAKTGGPIIAIKRLPVLGGPGAVA